MFSTVALIAAIAQAEKARPFYESFLQTDAAMAQRLQRAEAEAQRQSQLADAAWAKSRADTDALLKDVHNRMASLNSELSNSAKKQRTELALIERQRESEEAQLATAERKLKEKKAAVAPLASLLETGTQEDFLVPLRKAAAEAKAFAERMRKEAMSGMVAPSFLEEGEDFQVKAERSLAMAQQALSKLDADLASQKRELETETARARQEDEELRSPVAASFLQTGDSYDPLSPQALAEWRDQFTAKLQKAREAAGIHTPFHSSLIQSESNEDRLREDERKVARLQEDFDSQMGKLKQDNEAMMERAREEIAKAKEMKSKLEAQSKASSFVQTQRAFDLSKEHEKIKELRQKWHEEAEKLGQAKASDAEAELKSLVAQQDAKQQAAEVELGRLKEKLDRDLASMHKGLIAGSFIQKADSSESDRLLSRARELLNKLDGVKGKAHRSSKSGSSSFIQTSPADGLDENDEDDADDSLETVLNRPSFLQTGGEAERALAKAEADMAKLQADIRKQTAKLAANTITN